MELLDQMDPAEAIVLAIAHARLGNRGSLTGKRGVFMTAFLIVLINYGELLRHRTFLHRFR